MFVADRRGWHSLCPLEAEPAKVPSRAVPPANLRSLRLPFLGCPPIFAVSSEAYPDDVVGSVEYVVVFLVIDDAEGDFVWLVVAIAQARKPVSSSYVRCHEVSPQVSPRRRH